MILLNEKIQTFIFFAFVAFALLACSDDSKDVGGITEDQGFAVIDKTVAGVSQKGPFANGSTVQLYELNGIELVQTGKILTTQTSSNGGFAVPGVYLKSSFALLEVTGFYKNEITGKLSQSQITLRAVVDLLNREKVNVNLLTHLEYGRVQKLIAEGMGFDESKSQAEKEILSSFGVAGFKENFEDLNIFSLGKSDATLLAVSLAMLADRTDAEFSEFLANYAEDIEDDGILDDAGLKAGLVHGAQVICANEKLAEIRANMESWGLGDVPEFEKIILEISGCTENPVDKTAEKDTADNVAEKGNGDTATEENSDGNEFEKNTGDGAVEGGSDEGTGNETTEKGADGEGTEGETEGETIETKPLYDCGEYKCVTTEYLNQEMLAAGKYGELLDTRDNQVYRTTKICDATWMAQNLNYVTPSGESHCYDGDDTYCEKYGRLYVRADIQCPTGWHLPNDDEWLALMECVGKETAASALRAQTGWDLYPYFENKDAHGFSALPGGMYFSGDEGIAGWFFSATDYSDFTIAGANDMRKTTAAANTAISVRCVMD